MSAARLVGTIAAAVVVIVTPSRSWPHGTGKRPGFCRDDSGIALNAPEQIATRGLLGEHGA